MTSTFCEVAQESLLNVELVWGDDQGSDVRYLALSEIGLKSNLGTNLFITKYFRINTLKHIFMETGVEYNVVFMQRSTESKKEGFS